MLHLNPASLSIEVPAMPYYNSPTRAHNQQPMMIYFTNVLYALKKQLKCGVAKHIEQG